MEKDRIDLLIEQNKNAFDYIEKLYLESSYLIKEVAGILEDEEENFLIGKPSGFQISSTTSSGLEPNNVKSWLLKKFSVFFVNNEGNGNRKITIGKRGNTITKISNDLKVLYLKIVLHGENIREPMIYSDVLYGINRAGDSSEKFEKFEQFMGYMESNDSKIFRDIKRIDYKDRNIKVKGELIQNKLFEIKDSDTVVNKIINPTLELYRKY